MMLLSRIPLNELVYAYLRRFWLTIIPFFSYLEKQAGCEMLGKSRAIRVPTVLGLSTVQYWCEGGSHLQGQLN